MPLFSVCVESETKFMLKLNPLSSKSSSDKRAVPYGQSDVLL